MASAPSRLVSGSRPMASTTSVRSPVSAASTVHSCARETRWRIAAGSEGRLTSSRPRAPLPSTTHMLSTTTSRGRSATWPVLGRFSGNQPGVFVSMHWITAATSSPDGIGREHRLELADVLLLPALAIGDRREVDAPVGAPVRDWGEEVGKELGDV